ncbi:MAG: hypothetical protein RLN72_11190 [Henriciella sp.]
MSGLDWIGLYGAGLSTLLAVVALWSWWYRDTYLTVHGIHQFENWMGDDAFAFAITNAGRRPTIVWRVSVQFLTSKQAHSPIDSAKFDHSSMWNPAAKDVPVEGKPNTSKRQPNVLQPGDEIHGMAKPPACYEPTEHWIAIRASARGSRKDFTGWIAPQRKGD